MPAAVVRATPREYRKALLETFGADERELLAVTAADGDHQAATGLELLVQGARHFRRRGRDGDGGERRRLGQAERAVTHVNVDAVVAGGGECRARGLGKLRQTLDR